MKYVCTGMEKVNVKKILMGLAFGAAIAVPTFLPADAMAQSHRQKSKNQWRNLGIAGGAVGIYGLLSHNKTLTYGGLAGGAYSAYRYEQDRKSQSRANSRYRAQRYRSWSSGRAQRFRHAGDYRRTRHGYVSTSHGRHTSWPQHGHH